MLSSSLPDSWTWETEAKKRTHNPIIIGVCGGTASGKTSVCEDILRKLEDQRVVIVSQDSFYKALDHNTLLHVHTYNFDHPDAFDWPLLTEVLRSIKEGKRVEIPRYSFVTHSRQKETDPIYGADVIMFEGILAFYTQEIRDVMDMKIFADTDADTRLARRGILPFVFLQAEFGLFCDN